MRPKNLTIRYLVLGFLIALPFLACSLCSAVSR